MWLLNKIKNDAAQTGYNIPLPLLSNQPGMIENRYLQEII